MKMGSVPIFILAAHILSMLGFATFAALLPELRDLWRLSNFEAGVIGGMFFTGYIATVSYWTALTDRHDGRKVYLAGSLLAAAGSAGFGWLAEGFAGAVLCQGLLGAGIAATYMPGLRLLSERISGPAQSRYIAFSSSIHANATFPLQLATIAAVVNLVAVPASILGNEIALRIGRRRWILVAMAGSGSSGILLGLAAPWHWVIVLGLLVLYSMLVMAESATLTAGLVAAAPAGLRGAAMGLYSLAWFARRSTTWAGRFASPSSTGCRAISAPGCRRAASPEGRASR